MPTLDRICGRFCRQTRRGHVSKRTTDPPASSSGKKVRPPGPGKGFKLATKIFRPRHLRLSAKSEPVRSLSLRSLVRSFVRSLARRRAASDKSCSPPNQKVQNFRQLRAQFSTRNGPRFEILPEGSGPAESGPLFRHSFLSLGHWNEAELGPFLTACPIPDQFKMAAGTRD